MCNRQQQYRDAQQLACFIQQGSPSRSCRIRAEVLWLSRTLLSFTGGASASARLLTSAVRSPATPLASPSAF